MCLSHTPNTDMKHVLDKWWWWSWSDGECFRAFSDNKEPAAHMCHSFATTAGVTEPVKQGPEKAVGPNPLYFGAL